MSSRFSFIQTNVLPGTLLTLLIIEVGFHTFMRNLFGPYTSPIVLMIVSILISVVYFLHFYDPQEGRKIIDGRIRIQLSERKKHRWVWLLFLAGVAVNSYLANNAFQNLPVDIRYSDIIPVTMRYVENFVNGKTVYATMQFDGFERYPKYFPLRWLPFVIPYWLKFDPRWMAFGILMLALLINQFRLFGIERDTPCLVIKSVFPFFALAAFSYFDQYVPGYSMETMIAGYYILFGLSLFAAAPVAKAGGMLLVLLSRFSILFWVPLYAMVYGIEEKRRAITVSVLVMLGILLIFVLPFLPLEFAFLKKMAGYFNDFAASEANAWTWQELKDGKPQKLFKGIGMAVQFYSNESISVIERIRALKTTHLVASVGSVVLMAALFFATRKKVGANHFLLASAKLYLVVFYSFIYVPYTYLYLVPVLFSIVLLSNISFPHFRQVKT